MSDQKALDGMSILIDFGLQDLHLGQHGAIQTRLIEGHGNVQSLA